MKPSNTKPSNMKPSNTKPRASLERVLLVVGIFAIVIGLAVNRWSISFLFARPVEKASHNIIIAAFEALMIAGGLLAIATRRTLTIKKLLLLGVSSSLCLGLFWSFDLYLAGVAPDRSISFIDGVNIPDDELGWKPKPSSIGRHFFRDSYDVEYEMDADGFKLIDNEADTAFDIYFFGDSFTFGHGVANRDTFSTIVADDYLTDDVGVYNAGVMAYGLVQMYARLVSIQDRLEPGDLVVFTPLSEDMHRNFESLGRSQMLLNYVVSKKDDRSVQVSTYPTFVDGEIELRTVDTDLSWLERLSLRARNAPFTGRVAKRILGGEGRSVEEDAREAVLIVESAARLAEARGARFALILLPTTEECVDRRYEFDVSSIGHLDIIGRFPSQPDEVAALRLANDRHWNAQGHGLAARVIVETLVEEGLLDPKYVK